MNGAPSQFFLNLPYGETMIDQTANTPAYTSPYKFNGKELDEGTGMYYYGARYYDPRISVWVSVDPLAEKYPHFSSYIYCADNPLKYIDPDGKVVIIPPFAYVAYRVLGLMFEKYGSNPEMKTVGYSMNNPLNAREVKFDCNVSATNFQVNIGKAIGEPINDDGTPQNAIRHTLWQAMITSNIDSDHAKRIASAHEKSYETTELKRLDKLADLLNNKIGRAIGERNKGASNKELAVEVMKEYKNNGLWTVSKNDKGDYSLQKTKITNVQYQEAIKEINKKGENGLEK